MLNLEDFYDEIPLANQYFVQGDFERAIDIYAKILNDVNPKDETVPYLYLNYANALIKNSNQYFIDEVKNIHSGFNLEERKIYEDDLENAWQLLETCRSSFNILKDHSNLGRTYFLLGEISLLNNEFRDAIRDFVECESIYKSINIDAHEFTDLYLSMSSAYEFLEDYDLSIKYLNEVLEILKQQNMEYFEILERIEEIKSKKEKVKNEEVEDNSEYIDINFTKKRII